VNRTALLCSRFKECLDLLAGLRGVEAGDNSMLLTADKQYWFYEYISMIGLC